MRRLWRTLTEWMTDPYAVAGCLVIIAGGLVICAGVGFVVLISIILR